ncbi:MAG: hypothetical protein FWD61_10515 [Phycisphaerales bacterium]|nr:hypothetical protein [Phycisphaerales bacterium]
MFRLLAAGKISGDEEELRRYLEEKGWELWGLADIYERLDALADEEAGYENSVVSIVAKLILHYLSRIA